MAYRNADATVAATGATAVTPNDTTDVLTTRSLYIGGAGDLKAIMEDGGTITFVGLAAGTILPVQVTRVFATDTTATNIVGLY